MKAPQSRLSLGRIIRDIQKELPLISLFSLRVNQYGTLKLTSMKIVLLIIRRLLRLARWVDTLREPSKSQTIHISKLL